MYKFFLYSGSVNGQKYTGSYVVLKLLETLPKYEKFKIFFNNWGFFYTFMSCIERLWLFSNGYPHSRSNQGLSSSSWKRSKKARKRKSVSEPMRTVASQWQNGFTINASRWSPTIAILIHSVGLEGEIARKTVNWNWLPDSCGAI